MNNKIATVTEPWDIYSGGRAIEIWILQYSHRKKDMDMDMGALEQNYVNLNTVIVLQINNQRHITIDK